MTKEERNEVRGEAKKKGSDFDLAALKFLGIESEEKDGIQSVPEGNKGAVQGIVWECQNVKD